MLKSMINPDQSGKNKKLLSISILLFSTLLIFTFSLTANNISIDGNVTLTEQNTTSDYTHIKFDISWDNSWRTSSAPNNWDAAWVFAKWKLHSGTEWKHCTLNTSGHTAPSGSTIDAASDGTGIFIYPNAVGTGSVDWNNAKLRWNYGTDLVADDATVDVKVFAIEMVYVPQGDFYLGDGSSFNRFHDGDNASESFQVTSSQINFGQANNQLWALGDWDSPTGSLQTDYPTGFAAFYCMKYEISQGQYVGFLNTLTSTQDNTRYRTMFENDYRHGVWGGSQGSRFPERPYRACGFLSWMDGAAYADWAGLRPMTELEFEKACRGTQDAVAGEYAWGDVTITEATTIDADPGKEYGTETVNGNCNYEWGLEFTGGDEGRGPLRCGIFATGSSTRQQSGASYYGIMEMSGNLSERPVTLGNATGRAFTGNHGNGEIDASGNTDAANWPSTSAEGSGFRGGNWSYDDSDTRVSDRDDAVWANTDRNSIYGFRAVRTQ